jgi:hypothetical protein
MAKKTDKSAAQRRARQLIKKHQKDKQRHKTKGHLAISENAVQHQMLSEFGNVQNFMKNVLHLADLMRTDDDLKTLRFDPAAVYAQFDLTADRAALADVYAHQEELPAYAEEFEEFWHAKRRAVLETLVTEEFIERCDKVFKKLLVTKQGFKKDYRAALAGRLLVQSHRAAISRTEAPLEDNSLWELALLATLKENPRELPAPATEPVAAPADSGAPAPTTE